MSRQRPTITDVARSAGTSPATVSRVLSGTTRVSPGLRTAVEDAIRALDYVPNQSGRDLAGGGGDRAMGVIVPTIDNAIFARLVEAFQLRLSLAGITTLMGMSQFDEQTEFQQIRRLTSRNVDGIVLVGCAREKSVYDFLQTQGPPFIRVLCDDDDGISPVIGIDNFAAARLIGSHVIGYGHRRIGVVSGVLRGNDRAQRRLAGFRAALAAVDPDAAAVMPVVESRYSLTAAKPAVTELLRMAPDLTAILCANDVLAAGVISVLRDMGRETPEDMSVTGFDDIDLASVTAPSLTTIRVPQAEIGLAAAGTLLAMRDGDAPPSRILRHELILRGSVAPPRAC